MTGQRTPTADRGEPAQRELGRLLEAGPFAEALRAAIRARGLGLERIRYRLRGRGVSLSLATLSHWQSGRCRPERPESLLALGYLEDILGVPPGALRRLLGPPRSRGPYPPPG
ncbi:transcriptional regulator [Amycolatopsis sp. PS_44_ISF1]|uniref:transcriptional regulator n=1 Tax=Amycolatopsis sp. PS_44_ISF1 TaxID=2974917 RepID=UPI0028E041DA|nr:transcriptional regulator [Amycolatopsis sp. PS_44_ISF1]MDT8911229.1 transcriptional regulator [Amycolatopsis sp. PS_44_ISF1]